MPFGLGQPIRRKEDERLLTGKGAYTDDLDLPRQAWGAVVRSPHAHARIVSIDSAAARAAPGVLAVLTAADAAADAIADYVCAVSLKNLKGEPVFNPARAVLQGETVRYAGDLVAFVVAETREQARDAAELVQVDYEALAAVVDPRDADLPQAPRVWQQLDGNCALDWQPLDGAAATEAAFARAAKVVQLEIRQNRIAGAPMEPRVAIGEWDAASGRYTLHMPSQGVTHLRDNFAKLLGVPKESMRVLSRDTGGGFGVRNQTFPESTLVLWAARRLGRPVKWRADRSETFVADPHARDHRTLAEMAFDGAGRILGLRVHTHANMGAYFVDHTPFIPTLAGSRVSGTVYRLPLLDMRVRLMFTHSVPTDAYRGAGRPEMCYLTERLLDLGAAALGLGRDEIRRRNFIAPEELPWKTPVGVLIDSGRFAETTQMALARADWDGFAARRAESERRGRRRGLGLACYLDYTGGLKFEQARVRFTAEGRVQLMVGTYSQGQGHETAFSQIVANQLGVPTAQIDFMQGDSDLIDGFGTVGSRSAQMAGVPTLRASNQLVEKARRLAAHALEVASADLRFRDGAFQVEGTDLRLTLAEVARLSLDATRLPPGETPGLDETHRYERKSDGTFPNGAHIVEVEVDPETGRIEILRYVCVDDCGVPINPLIVEGQVQGGVVQGLGQALLESAEYDAASGQYLAGSFMDYAMPRASDMPNIEVSLNVVPAPNNDLGVKGIGEAGCCVAPSALISAVADALGVPHLDMPATPESVWRILRACAAKR
jgi:carbon-monoxide dehydrogenase large subunit